jgi:lycopene cyclase domain-containing protein
VTYTELAAVAVLLMVSCDLWLIRTRLVRRRSFWIAYAIMSLFELLSDGVLTGARVVRYNPVSILGVRVAYAPVEDLAFGFALILLTLACWVRITNGSSRAPIDNP